ncbi:MAG: RHS repeat-associated core domain-containing protein [Holophagales bacterium]|nr:RHS repeat-associated core domain-containing protein [Holophagales bacterium]
MYRHLCATLLLLAAGPSYADGLELDPTQDVRSGTLELGYDKYGRVKRLTYPDGSTAAYSFNLREGHSRVTYNTMEVVPFARYAPSGMLTERPISDGGVLSTEFRSYDALGRLRSQRLARDAGGVDAYSAEGMEYNAWGFLAGMRRNDVLVGDTQVSYGYDGRGRLESFGLGGASAAYHYDDRGNLRAREGFAGHGLSLPSFSMTFDAANRPESSDWKFDPAGRLIEDRDFLYAYNDAGRLALVTDSHGNLVAHYLYDAAGHRVRKLTDQRVTYYYRSGGVVVSEETFDLDGDLIERRNHVSHNGDHVMTAVHGSSDSYRYQLSDRLGNPAVRWGGGQTSYQEYSPFGIQMRTAAEDARRGAHGFTGHEEDGETGAVYMRARYYDPELGRFTRPDPARDSDPWRPGSFNLYQYAKNNPVNLHDPSGLIGEDIVGSDRSINDVLEELNTFLTEINDDLKHLEGGGKKVADGLGKAKLKKLKKAVKKTLGVVKEVKEAADAAKKGSEKLLPPDTTSFREGAEFLHEQGGLDKTALDHALSLVDAAATVRSGQLLGQGEVWLAAGDAIAYYTSWESLIRQYLVRVNRRAFGDK